MGTTIAELTKTCTKCGEELPVSLFGTKSSSKDKHQSLCKPCMKIAGAAWRASNQDRIAETNAAYKANNADKIRESKLRYAVNNQHKIVAYREANKDKNLARALAWAEKYPERAAAIKAEWANDNREKVLELNRKWRDNNKEKVKESNANWGKRNRDKTRIHCHNRRERTRKNGGMLSSDIVNKLLALQRGKCACGCGQSLCTKYHIDHIVPISKGGRNEDSNVQLLRDTCNLSKGGRDPIEFMQSRGFLL